MSVIMETRNRLHTAQDLIRLDAKGLRYELIEGEFQEMAPSGPTHGNATSRLSHYVGDHVYRSDLGETFAAETGFLISRNPDTVLAPDLAFILEDRLPAEFPAGYCTIVPDLVVETRSPGDSDLFVLEKTARWLDAGVRLVWNVDPTSRTVSVHSAGQTAQSLGATDVLDGGDVLPGFRLPVSNIFRAARAK